MSCRRATLRNLLRGLEGSDLRSHAAKPFVPVTAVRASSSDGGVSIDRSGLVLPPGTRSGTGTGRDASISSSIGTRAKKTPMEEHLASLILHRGGPLTVAEFMHDALTHPTHGYYTAKDDVFGSRGDFITSPDISQLFGEAIGIWAVATWHSLGSPAKFKLVELGPGRGTLMSDLLRGTKNFRAFRDALEEVALVEVSEVLREKQREALLGEKDRVRHYASLGEVEVDDRVPTLYIAHELLDALPVHQFVKRDGAWREVLVDVADEDEGQHAFRLVVAPYDTFALRTVLPARLRELDEATRESLDAIEVSPAVIGLVSDLAQRIKKNGGAAILIDYGQDGPYESSLVGIKNHDFVDVLSDPGKVDLSAYVDFDAVRSSAKKEGVVMHGPIDQGILLKALGIDERLQALVDSNAGGDDDATKRLVDGYRRIVGGGNGEMGVRYKAVCLMNEARGGAVGF